MPEPSDGGYGGTLPPGGLCWISPSDLAGQVNNLMSRVAQLESEVNLLKSANVNAIQLSDLATTGDLGNILFGNIGNAVLIEELALFNAVYARTWHLRAPAENVEAQRNILIITNDNDFTPATPSSTGSESTALTVFQVTQAGIYRVSAGAQMSAGNPPGAFASAIIDIAHSESVYYEHAVDVLSLDTVSTGVNAENYVNPSLSLDFYMEAGDTVQCAFVHRVVTNTIQHDYFFAQIIQLAKGLS